MIAYIYPQKVTVKYAMRKLYNPSAPNLVVVCINQVLHGDFLGKFYTRIDLEPTAFCSTMDMVMKMDSFYNRIRFPQATLQARSFLKNGSQVCAGKANCTYQIQQEAEKIVEQRGDVATFVVHVQYRQNATWQGKIVWAEKQAELPFRSALEMMRLMDQAIMQQPEGDTEKPDV